MPTANEKRREIAPKQQVPAGDGHSQHFIPSIEFGQLAGLRPRSARFALMQAQEGNPWRGAKLNVRKVRGRGGEQLEVAVSSLPIPLRAKWHRQQPQADLRDQVEEHLALIEEDLRDGGRKNRKRFIKAPWTQEEREARHGAFKRLPTSTQQKTKKRWTIVQRFHSFRATSLPEMRCYELAALEAGRSVSAVRNWVGLCEGLDRGDWLVALAPKHHGRNVRADISLDASNYIHSEYFKLTKPSLKPIYRRATKLALEHSWTLPSYATVKRLIDAEPHSYHVLMREGEEAFELLYPTQQRDYSMLHVSEIWCCDGRKADVFCRWEDGTVSRPIVITWLEVRSRVILSYVIARTESADAIRLAFKAAAEKCGGLIPDSVLLDNSRAFASKLLSGGAPNRFRFQVREDDIPGIFTLLGIEIIWALPFHGRSKPVESLHRQYAEAEKRFDGAYCGNRPDARPEDCDPAKAVSIEQYRALLDETLAMYHSTPHRGHGMEGRSPREVYEALLPQSAPRQATREQLWICCLAAERVRLAPDNGEVRIMGNRYWTEKLAEQPRDRDYVARFNPEDAEEPVAVFDGERFICYAPILARTGFRDSAAAKTGARARGQFLKSVKQQHAARREMSKAREWITPPDVSNTLQAEVAEALLPTPKVVAPLRPERDYRPEKAEAPIYSQDEFMDIVLNNQPRRN